MIWVSSLALAMAAAGAAPAKPALPPETPPLPASVVGTAPESVLSVPIAPESGPDQSVTLGEAVPGRWWQAFASPALDALVDRALDHNADIAAATANLAQAHQLVAAARGVLFPQVDAGYNVVQQRLSEALASPTTDPNASLFSLHTAQVSVTYSLDLFGGNAARVRSSKAAERAIGARLEGVRNIVSANVTLAVIQNAALDAQYEAASRAVENNRQILTLLKAREELGAVGRSDVEAQQSALASAELVLPGLERARRANLAALAVLLGEAPGTPLPGLPSLAELNLPTDLPLSLPSQLVAQRPDVQAGAAAMEGAAADAKAALVARLPAITLSASAGGIAGKIGNLFATGNPFWALIGGIAAPLFHGGTLKAQQKAAEAALETAKANYKGLVLQSLADVSNSLTALSTDGNLLDAADRADQSAQTNLGYVRRQLDLGAVGSLAVLNASATAQAARSQLIAAKAARLSDTVGLFTALGGGRLK